MHIQPHSQGHNKEGKERPPLLFLKIKKGVLIFGKKGLDCVHLWVKFSIQNVVLRVSRRKKFPAGPLFFCFWGNVYWNALVPQTPSFTCPEKFQVAHLHSCIIHFAKRLLWIRPCLDNCIVICTVTLSYILHQRHSEFWHIQNSVYLSICQYIQSYPALLKYIHTYGDIIEAYSGLFRHIQHPV